MTASLLQSCRTHGCKPLWLLGPGDPRRVGSPRVEAAKAGCVQTPSCEMLRPRLHYRSRLRGERGDVPACCPGLWEELQSALEATKLEAWAPGGTFKMPLSGWKIGIFSFGLLPAQNCFFVCSSPEGLMSGRLVVHQSGM